MQKKCLYIRIIASILFSGLLGSTNIFAQSIAERFYPNVCNCFDKNYTSGNLDLKLFQKCFDLKSEGNRNEFEDFLRQELDSNNTNLTYEEELELSRKMGEQLFDDLQEPLVNNCDSYYNFLLECKKAILTNMSGGVSKKEADSLSILIKNGNWTEQTTWQMGSYQLGVGNIQMAKANFHKSLEKNPLHLPSLFFLGVVNDTEGNHDKAIQRYNQVIEQEEESLSFIVNMFLVVAKREAKEK
ncbi:MAG: hypothetical protein AAGD88_07990 [Bacteroidota bacterium]